MALSSDIDYRLKPAGPTARFPVKNAVTLYKNSLVGLDLATGYVEPFDDAPGLVPVGLCMRQVTGDTSVAPAVTAEVRVDGPVIEDVTVAGATAISCIGKLVYATDDATLTLTRQADDSPPVGRVHYWAGTSGKADVRLLSLGEAMHQAFAPAAGAHGIAFPAVQCGSLAVNDLVARRVMRGSGRVTGFRLRVTEEFDGGDTGVLTLALRVGGTSIGTVTLDADGAGAGGGATFPTVANPTYGVAESADLTETLFHDGDVLDVAVTANDPDIGTGSVCVEVDVEASA